MRDITPTERMQVLNTYIQKRRRKAGYWDNRKTEKTVYVLEIEHDAACDTEALSVMFEGGAQGNIKTIKVRSVESAS